MLGLRERIEENGSAPGTGEAKRSAAAPADPEVVDRPLRRRFSPSYKLRIVEEADRCTEPGEVGRLLRREGLYSSHLTTWRKAARSGSLISSLFLNGNPFDRIGGSWTSSDRSTDAHGAERPRKPDGARPRRRHEVPATRSSSAARRPSCRGGRFRTVSWVGAFFGAVSRPR